MHSNPSIITFMWHIFHTKKLGKHDFKAMPKETVNFHYHIWQSIWNINKHAEYNLLLSSYYILCKIILQESNKNTAKFLHQLSTAHITNAHMTHNAFQLSSDHNWSKSMNRKNRRIVTFLHYLRHECMQVLVL